EDQRCSGCRDLAGSAAWPALVGVALGVAAVQDYGGVVADPERPQRCVELFGRAAVPVARALDLVCIEVERAGKVAVRVLLGNAEVDVEEQHRPVWCSLGRAALQ